MSKLILLHVIVTEIGQSDFTRRVNVTGYMSFRRASIPPYYMSNTVVFCLNYTSIHTCDRRSSTFRSGVEYRHNRSRV